MFIGLRKVTQYKYQIPYNCAKCQLRIVKSYSDSVALKKGVKAYWTLQTEASSVADGRNAKELGFIDWECEIGAGGSLRFGFGMEIVTPPRVSWVKQ